RPGGGAGRAAGRGGRQPAPGPVRPPARRGGRRGARPGRRRVAGARGGRPDRRRGLRPPSRAPRPPLLPLRLPRGVRRPAGVTAVATGSIAFDYILTFRGRFGDHIIPDKAHVINLSFLVDSMDRRRGGVAANYAYTLALLGHPAAVLATAGADAAGYRAWLEG